MKKINNQEIDETVYAIFSERIDDLREEISINEIREDCPDRLDYCKCDCKAKAQEFLKKMEDGK